MFKVIVELPTRSAADAFVRSLQEQYVDTVFAYQTHNLPVDKAVDRRVNLKTTIKLEE